MSPTTDGNRVLEEISGAVEAEGGIRGRDDARRVVDSVLWGFQRHLPFDAFEALASAVGLPGQDGPSPLDAEDSSIARFFEELADREEIEIDRAAVHARVVAEVLTSRMSSAELEALSAEVPDDFLALFERQGRGQLTEDDGSTRGVEEVGNSEAESG